MAKLMIPFDQAYLKAVLSYEPATGEFYWRGKPREDFKSDRAWNACNSRLVGTRAGHNNGSGYRKIEVRGKGYLAHRLAWFYVHGKWPHEIDHINGSRSDNRITNLREVDRRINSMNRCLRSDNTTGHPGVYPAVNDRWKAMISVSGERKTLGYFLSKDEAIAARKQAETSNGFGPNHGSGANG